MVTLISFIIVMAGAANWLCIGLMQYDFVAGFFGTQSSFLSRLIYIVVGFAAIWLLIMAFKQRGTIKLNSNGFKKIDDPLAKDKKFRQKQNTEHENQHEHRTDNQTNENSHANVEFANEFHEQNSNSHRNPFE